MITLGLWFVVVFLLGMFGGLMVALTLQAALARRDDESASARADVLTAGLPPAQRRYCIVGERELWTPDDDADLPSDTGSAAVVFYRRG